MFDSNQNLISINKNLMIGIYILSKILLLFCVLTIYHIINNFQIINAKNICTD